MTNSLPASAPGAYSGGQVARLSFQIVPGAAKPKPGQLEMRTRLFRDGVEVWQSGLTPAQIGAANLVAASLPVPNGLGAGEYLLRVDVNAKDAPDSSAAWQPSPTHALLKVPTRRGIRLESRATATPLCCASRSQGRNPR